ncbi:hypothetical protein [Burkholderia ubonensis]|uniref:Uncharacterized protein n=1 Tax=Burkholderia ubonensis subsp. mesacidophila TaxID=265293 RepID=A0A2A4FFT1_9BURK|nr:hypothetical protein [Burkholderia ubonensis]PCE31975.1 hypothetical protein BZL54_12805 [Burkholderia ubonensis subsp. mesacidophila]
MIDRQPDAAGLMSFFYGRFDMKSASTEELEFLSSATAPDEAGALRDTLDGIACLVAEDLRKERGRRVGNFQESSVPSLLWSIARQVDAIGQMAFIASEADYELRDRAVRASSTFCRRSTSKQSLSDKGSE